MHQSFKDGFEKQSSITIKPALSSVRLNTPKLNTKPSVNVIDYSNMHIPRTGMTGAQYRAKQQAGSGLMKNGSMDKEAVLWAAPIVHGVQNFIGSKLIKSKGFAKNLSKNLQEGFMQMPESRFSAFKRGLMGGAVLPEIGAMQSHARQIGENVAKSLASRGINRISYADRAILNNVLKGNFNRVAKHLDPKNVVHNVVAKHVKELTGVDMIGNVNLDSLEEVWKSHKSPLTSNIVSNALSAKMPQRTKKQVENYMAGAPVTRHNYEYAGNIVGAAPLAALDPLTAGMNAFKTTMTNKNTRDALNKVPGLEKGVKAVDDFFVNKPLKDAFTNAAAGKPHSKLKEGFGTYVVNPISGSSITTARLLGEQRHQAIKATKDATPAPAPEKSGWKPWAVGGGLAATGMGVAGLGYLAGKDNKDSR